MPAKGSLNAHIFTSSANLPIQEATVSVIQKKEDGQEELLSLQLTDQSGNTKTISLPTPPTADSQSPGNPIGYVLVDIAADFPDFERVLVKDVQVFPDTITLQDIQLLPRDALPALWGESQVFSVTSQNL